MTTGFVSLPELRQRKKAGPSLTRYYNSKYHGRNRYYTRTWRRAVVFNVHLCGISSLTGRREVGARQINRTDVREASIEGYANDARLIYSTTSAVGLDACLCQTRAHTPPGCYISIWHPVESSVNRLLESYGSGSTRCSITLYLVALLYGVILHFFFSCKAINVFASF